MDRGRQRLSESREMSIPRSRSKLQAIFYIEPCDLNLANGPGTRTLPWRNG